MLVKHSIERTNNVHGEVREQAVQCIDRARMAGNASERKLYLRLALRWLEIAISMESDTIELSATPRRQLQ